MATVLKFATGEVLLNLQRFIQAYSPAHRSTSVPRGDHIFSAWRASSRFCPMRLFFDDLVLDWRNQYPTVNTVRGTQIATYIQKSIAILTLEVSVSNENKFIPKMVCKGLLALSCSTRLRIHTAMKEAGR